MVKGEKAKKTGGEREGKKENLGATGPDDKLSGKKKGGGGGK